MHFLSHLATLFKGGMPGFQSVCMWIISVPVTTIGVITWRSTEATLHGAQLIIGFLTGLTGLAIGTMGVIYWFRRIRAQNQNLNPRRKR